MRDTLARRVSHTQRMEANAIGAPDAQPKSLTNQEMKKEKINNKLCRTGATVCYDGRWY